MIHLADQLTEDQICSSQGLDVIIGATRHHFRSEAETVFGQSVFGQILANLFLAPADLGQCIFGQSALQTGVCRGGGPWRVRGPKSGGPKEWDSKPQKRGGPKCGVRRVRDAKIAGRSSLKLELETQS